MVRSIKFLGATLAAAQDPERPHLAQAWTARSSGDGPDDGTVSAESYLNTKEKFGHIWDMGAAGKKITRCGKDFGVYGGKCKAYYLKYYAVDCCYCDDASFKEWDISKKASFVALEDTTELDDKPIVGAEHWNEKETIFGKLTLASYDYFLHREDAGNDTADVISHRIDFFTAAINGTILYGDFQVQHDIEAHAAAWDLPTECKKTNLLKCGCDAGDDVHEKYFKHDYAISQATTTAV